MFDSEYFEPQRKSFRHDRHDKIKILFKNRLLGYSNTIIVSGDFTSELPSSTTFKELYSFLKDKIDPTNKYNLALFFDSSEEYEKYEKEFQFQYSHYNARYMIDNPTKKSEYSFYKKILPNNVTLQENDLTKISSIVFTTNNK